VVVAGSLTAVLVAPVVVAAQVITQAQRLSIGPAALEPEAKAMLAAVVQTPKVMPSEMAAVVVVLVVAVLTLSETLVVVEPVARVLVTQSAPGQPNTMAAVVVAVL
jgi:hypothetical protein